MKQTWVKGLLALIIVMAYLALPAHAGIIITEGKIAEEQEPTKDTAKNAASSKRRPVTTEKQVDEGDDAAPACVELDEDGFCVQVDAGVDDVPLKEVGDLNNDDPEGWDCTPIGAGVEVCEPTGPAGASPGAGAGGGLGDVSAQPQLAGCQAGKTDASLWLALLALLLVPFRRRASEWGPSLS